mgnify:CR=1 FL=1
MRRRVRPTRYTLNQGPCCSRGPFAGRIEPSHRERSKTIADLEKLAFKRDRAYLVRLLVLISLGLAGGLYIAVHLTSDQSKDRVSEAIFGTTVGSMAQDGGVTEKDAKEP